MGGHAIRTPNRLLITADGGGSNGCRCRFWKVALQGLANETGLRISVCHLPPGTSKWNKIEHRMFCHITVNWRGRPLVSREVVVNLIGHTTTKTGLAIQSELDEGNYPTGREVSDEQMESLSIRRTSSTASGTTQSSRGSKVDSLLWRDTLGRIKPKSSRKTKPILCPLWARDERRMASGGSGGWPVAGEQWANACTASRC